MLIDIVKAHQVKKEGTLAIVIPKEIREKFRIKKLIQKSSKFKI